MQELVYQKAKTFFRNETTVKQYMMIQTDIVLDSIGESSLGKYNTTQYRVYYDFNLSFCLCNIYSPGK